MSDPKNDARETASSGRKARRPYKPPRILSREKIEGRANVCDPLAGGEATGDLSCSVTRS